MSLALALPDDPVAQAVVAPPTDLELAQLRFRHVCAQLQRMPAPLERFQDRNPLDAWKLFSAHSAILSVPNNAVLKVANYTQHLEFAGSSWTRMLFEEARRRQGVDVANCKRDEQGRLVESGDLSWARPPRLPRIQMATDREIGVSKFDNGSHQEWLHGDTELAIIWIEPGGRRNEGITGALIDAVNMAERLNVPLWLSFDVRHPYGPKHAHHDERIDQWLETATKVELAQPSPMALPRKAAK